MMEVAGRYTQLPIARQLCIARVREPVTAGVRLPVARIKANTVIAAAAAPAPGRRGVAAAISCLVPVLCVFRAVLAAFVTQYLDRLDRSTTREHIQL